MFSNIKRLVIVGVTATVIVMIASRVHDALVNDDVDDEPEPKSGCGGCPSQR